MDVYFAEKPSVGRILADAVGATHKEDGYYVGDGVAVTWGFGHLVGIAEPEAMNPAWGKPWNKAVLPMVPEHWKLAALPGPGVKKQLDRVMQLFREVDTIICATDAGREGELIFRLVYHLSRSEAQVKRLWVSDLTPAGIQKGLADLRPAVEYDRLYQAARLRAYADWLVGLNATRAYTLHHGTLCTVGRVQTPTLAMIAARQQAIASFEPKPFWEATTTLNGAAFKVVNPKGAERFRFEDQAEAQARVSLGGQEATVLDASEKEKTVAAPQLYDLPSLQVEASKVLGLTAAETLKQCQALYEGQYITYPRTESRHLPENMVETFSGILEGCPEGLDTFRPDEPGHPGKRFVDDGKLTDHHAIIPTGKPFHGDPSGEPLFLLIWKRFLAMFQPAQVKSETEVSLRVGDDHLVYKGVRVLDDGWHRIYQKETQGRKAPALPFHKDETYTVGEVSLEEKKTKPPRPYDDGTLISAMKNAGRHLDDDDLAESMTGGLGTPATRADVIEKLIRTGYLERDKKVFRVTEKGLGLLRSVADELKKPDLTAEWERRLKAVENGGEDADAFYRDIVAFVERLIPEIWKTDRVEIKGIGPCPKCSKGQVRGNSKAYGCSLWRDGCDFTIWKTIAGKTVTDAMVVTLLTKGKTQLIKGLKGKNRPFDAHLVLGTDHHITFAFPARKGARAGTRNGGHPSRANRKKTHY